MTINNPQEVGGVREQVREVRGQILVRYEEGLRLQEYPDGYRNDVWRERRKSSPPRVEMTSADDLRLSRQKSFVGDMVCVFVGDIVCVFVGDIVCVFAGDIV